MHLREQEVILKIVKRHLTPYFMKMLALVIVSIPLYFFLYAIGNDAEGEWIYYAYAAVSFFMGILAAIISLDYLLDKIVITNKRVIGIDWKSLFKKHENEAELNDIQDVETKDKGVLSRLSVLNYGLLQIETAASQTCIVFQDCPDPNTVKHFLMTNIEHHRARHAALAGHASPNGGIL